MSRNDALERLCGSAIAADTADVTPAKPLAPFDEGVMAFLSDLSAVLMKDKDAKPYPDVTTFAFFCRRASVEGMRKQYDGMLDDRVGRGLTFHIAPSNVPINFAYSLVAALLAGNQCVVKASSRDFAQIRIVCRAMNALLQGEHKALAPYVNVVIYARDRQDVTEKLSAQCDARIIWGGDETVKRVRMAALTPHGFDVTFADRYSLLVISPDAVCKMDEKQLAQLAIGFYNDTYLTDQNACSAPRLVYWLGEGAKLKQAQDRFWTAVHDYAKTRYQLEPVVAVDKLTAACRVGIELEGAKMEPMPDNLVVRVAVSKLTPGIDVYRSAGGFFLEYADTTLQALAKVAERRYQTLSYIGIEPKELVRFVRENGVKGIDRITPVGHTMDFSLTWDGYDLIGTLSRRLSAF